MDVFRSNQQFLVIKQLQSSNKIETNTQNVAKGNGLLQMLEENLLITKRQRGNNAQDVRHFVLLRPTLHTASLSHLMKVA